MFTTPAVGVGRSVGANDGVSVGRSVGSGPSVGAACRRRRGLERRRGGGGWLRRRLGKCKHCQHCDTENQQQQQQGDVQRSTIARNMEPPAVPAIPESEPRATLQRAGPCSLTTNANAIARACISIIRPISRDVKGDD